MLLDGLFMHPAGGALAVNAQAVARSHVLSEQIQQLRHLALLLFPLPHQAQQVVQLPRKPLQRLVVLFQAPLHEVPGFVGKGVDGNGNLGGVKGPVFQVATAGIASGWLLGHGSRLTFRSLSR